MVTEATWTLEELGARVRDALAGCVPPGSARVRAVPDARTIRYYTTLGLVDRPELDGRRALYGERHLLQLVAIKRLQTAGLSLVEVQDVIAGLPDVALRELTEMELGVAAPASRQSAPEPKAEAEAPELKAEVAATEVAATEVAATDGPATGARGRREFWRDVPDVAPEPEPAPAAAPGDAGSLAWGARPDHSVPGVSALLALELAPGVSLVLRDGRRPDEHDLQALREAAGPLLCMLEDRGLLPGPRGGERS